MTETKAPRDVLKSYFVANAIPTQEQFAQLIDSCLNWVDDNIAPPKAGGDPVVINTGLTVKGTASLEGGLTISSDEKNTTISANNASINLGDVFIAHGREKDKYLYFDATTPKCEHSGAPDTNADAKGAGIGGELKVPDVAVDGEPADQIASMLTSLKLNPNPSFIVVGDQTRTQRLTVCRELDAKSSLTVGGAFTANGGLTVSHGATCTKDLRVGGSLSFLSANEKDGRPAMCIAAYFPLSTKDASNPPTAGDVVVINPDGGIAKFPGTPRDRDETPAAIGVVTDEAAMVFGGDNRGKKLVALYGVAKCKINSTTLNGGPDKGIITVRAGNMLSAALEGSAEPYQDSAGGKLRPFAIALQDAAREGGLIDVLLHGAG